MDRYDALLLIGGLAMATGFGLISIPLGLIVGGALCIGLAIVGARVQTREAGQPHRAAPTKAKS